MERSIIVRIKEIYYPVLTAFGVPANLMTIIILSKGNCGLSKCISVYMMAMTTANLLVMIFNIVVYHIFTYHFPHSFLSYTVVCKFVVYVNCTTLDMSVWFTVSFTFDRFVAICCQKFKTKYCTVKSAATVLTTVSVLIYLEDIPFLFAFEHDRMADNVHRGCRSSVAFLLSPAGAAYSWLQSVLISWFPFALILLFNGLTVRRISIAGRVRRKLRGNNLENQKDPKTDNRRKSIILLFTVSGSFVLLWLTAAVSFLVNRVTNTVHYGDDHGKLAYIAAESGYMLMHLNSCTNACIYAATQTKFREELKKLAKSPYTFILTLDKN
ncbi:putative G-protein coupled receptor 139 [Cetorhinus maximus]